MEEILPKLKKIISDNFGVSGDLILPSAHLLMDLNLSEIETTDLMGFISKEFKLHLPEGLEIDSMQTVQDLVLFIEQNINEL